MPVAVPVEEPSVADWEVSELGARQKTIRNFAYAVFGLIAVVTLGIMTDWVLRSPSTPVWPAGTSPEAQKAAFENFRGLNAVFMERAKDMFDLIVVKGLLPLFATMIGVLLGRRTDEANP